MIYIHTISVTFSYPPSIVYIARTGINNDTVTVIFPCQYPDDYEEVTEEQLVEYRMARSEEPWERAIAPPHTTITGNVAALSAPFICII